MESALEQRMREIAKEMIDQDDTSDQFAVSQTPYHVHNGSDSSRIKMSDLSGKFLFMSYTLPGADAATAANYSIFHIVPSACTVSQIQEVHATAGTDGSAVSLDIEKLTGTTAPGSGTKLTSSVINLKGAINTVVTASLSTTVGAVQLAAGDRLALRLTGTPTSVANVTVTLIIGF